MKDAALPVADETRFAIPCAEDQVDFLIRLYFGFEGDYLRSCVRRAYLDMNRTMHGFGKHARADAIRDSAHQKVCELISELRAAGPRMDQARFDNWHRQADHALRVHYFEEGFKSLSVGQSQKWPNMALKYVFTMGEKRLPGYGSVYPYAHVPIDNIILSALRPTGAPSLGARWSRLDEYSTYMRFQRWVRNHYPNSAPLAVEFRLWLGAEANGARTPQMQ